MFGIKANSVSDSKWYGIMKKIISIGKLIPIDTITDAARVQLRLDTIRWWVRQARMKAKQEDLIMPKLKTNKGSFPQTSDPQFSSSVTAFKIDPAQKLIKNPPAPAHQICDPGPPVELVEEAWWRGDHGAWKPQPLHADGPVDSGDGAHRHVCARHQQGHQCHRRDQRFLYFHLSRWHCGYRSYLYSVWSCYIP